MTDTTEKEQDFDNLYQSASRGLDVARTAVTLTTLARRGNKYIEFTDSTPELKQAYEKPFVDGAPKELDNLAVEYLARTSLILKRLDEYNGKTEEQIQKAQELQNRFDKLYSSLEEIIKTKPELDSEESETNGEGRNCSKSNEA